MSDKTFYEKVAEIQQKLKAPKGQYNSFGKYSYRNCEDILEAVKPLLGDLVLTLEDEIIQVGQEFKTDYVKSYQLDKQTNTSHLISETPVASGARIYVRATATISQQPSVQYFLKRDEPKEAARPINKIPKLSISVSAYAREPLVKKGMDESQITGAASSYARKYALAGLFLLDDTRDADSQDNTKYNVQQESSQKTMSNGPLNNDKPTEGMKKMLWALLYKKYEGQEIPQEQADFVNKCSGTQCKKAIDKLQAELEK